jgi:hypothetical protein
MASDKQLCEYIKNTDGNATLQNFIEDWEPIGGFAWEKLSQRGLVTLDGNKIVLTDKGKEFLNGQR